MAVHLTKIYTRTGDAGETGLSNFQRVSKNDPRLKAYADCEETNCVLGVALAGGGITDEVREVLSRIQNELFDAGADLATPIEENPKYPPLRVEQSYIDGLETDCDRFNDRLGNLDSFILPGGTPAGAHINLARVVCRRAERSAWQAYHAHPETTSILPAKYLNRLSDLLFILGRVVNDGNDITWVPGSGRPRPGAADHSDTDN
ncbi:cob(I)yrinic acid a,c-diamide adenosyltransferase [Corynebacterium mendelii]|uniref:Corrinoid adenosyltransferase n=1 Tax=Corynebacterium mendelii TaxID=2765362 RepID=A0A939IXZ8_9CORY|nr:cob(I)yrinic acid a,c-diamide adenosyltransferase [Corynebacterium mendelii]MBN9645005.1 cob(I)yrinic acid a,c-diamide adenosyltransferase [Corynebacterium mendelii]